MRRFELGMTIDYASSWTVVDAVREFFQNAIDEEKENPENKMSFYYDEDSKTLSIGNLKSKLTPKTLLLGCSSKKDRSDLIGEHGEGYKVATVVLLRNGISVNIYNNESKEVWQSRVVRSRRYDADVVCFDIEKKIFSKKENLCIDLVGIIPEMYKKIVDCNLHLQDNIGEFVETEVGRILKNPKYSGMIFVEGLYVCTKSTIEDGYDFNAGEIQLDRDRGLVDTFDIKFAIASMYLSMGDMSYVAENIKSKDLEYISSKLKYLNLCKKESVKELSDMVYGDFMEEYGEDAIPVSSTSEFNMFANSGLKPVMIDSHINEVIRSTGRTFYDSIEVLDIDKEFENWVSRNSFLLDDLEIQKLRFLWSKK